LDFPSAEGTGPAVYTAPVRVVHARALADVLPALTEVQRMTRDGFHAVGFVAYEAAPALDPAMVTVAPGNALPLLAFGLFEAPTSPVPTAPAPAAPVEPPVADWSLDASPEAHADAVRRIRHAIAEGRTYQVNLTTRLRAAFDGSPEALYHRLRRAQGGGYHAYIDLGRHCILSASPELFFETRGRTITTRPMKGTRPRGRWREEDRTLREELAGSAKDRAENLMIVDLLRNDLGRVSAPGTVRAPDLWAIERYRTVWQMTSTVTGMLRDDVGLVDLFRALFPCGSVTGAPKISTMELIAELEPSPRGVYCGAIGRILPGGDCTFNVPIRTAVIDRDAGRIAYGTGGGVVWDSTPEAEWAELRAKTAVVRSPWPRFRLLETLGVRQGTPVRLDRHLRRMAASADRFDFPFPEDDLRAAVHRAARSLPAEPDPGPAGSAALLRVTLGEDGSVRAETRPLDRAHASLHRAPLADSHTPEHGLGPRPDGDPDRRTVVAARAPVDSADLFLYHKTTHRAVYDRHLADAPEFAWDVLLQNEHGRVTEFCRGNVVAELDGRLLTPPRTAGLLPGCFRAQLLEDGRIEEADLSLDDVANARALWFINSARGWVPVRLQPRD
jgi:para-aminobenzoate synthetase/4-amino-4-deoxychorismate lyase